MGITALIAKKRKMLENRKYDNIQRKEAQLVK